jgi:hypothetical protein
MENTSSFKHDVESSSLLLLSPTEPKKSRLVPQKSWEEAGGGNTNSSQQTAVSILRLPDELLVFLFKSCSVLMFI